MKFPTGAVVLSSAILSACAQWPSAGQGGDADRYTASHYYEPAATLIETEAYQLSQLETLQAQLDVLSLQGARVCIPASVKRLSLLSQRVRRQLQGGLFADAGQDLVVFQHELRFLRQQFITISRQTGCHVNTVQALPAQALLFSVYFDRSEDVLSDSFRAQLQWHIEQFSPNAKWVLKGYADARGSEGANAELAQRRVNTVVEILQQQGVDLMNIQSESHGEASPFMSEDDAFALGMNRRVDLYVIDQPQAADSIPVQQWQDLGLQPHRHLFTGWE